MNMFSLNKAEAAGCPGELVQAHYDTLYVATFREEFVNLLLSREEGQVANIEC